MNLPLFIAARYLIARKRHNIINVISAISAIGMALGTAAIILILSVYNGFNKVVDDNVSNTGPDLVVTPTKGKCFVAEAWLHDTISSFPGITSVRCVVEENMFLVYGDNQSVARVKGTDGSEMYRNEVPLCNVGQTVAGKLGIMPQFITPLEIWYPDRTAKISLSNPSESLASIKVFPENLIPSNAMDGDAVIIPLDKMRELMHYENEVSAIEIDLADKDDKAVAKALRTALGDRFTVSDRYARNPALYKMMYYEKAAIFLILIFVVIIIAFNIFGSLSMLIIEKTEDIKTLRGMGADNRTIRSIFTLEGWIISLCGLFAGLIIGLAVSVLQMKTGFVKLPGNYLITSYPIVIKFTDIALTSIIVAIIGWMISLVCTRKIKI